MARPRTGDKDRLIVDAAIELFLERGVRGTTISDIAKKAGVATGTVYVYHKDKGAVVRRVAFAFAERHEAFVSSILSTRRKPQRKLSDYLLGFYDLWQPFGGNSVGAMELAEAVLEHAPETLEIARKEFLNAIKAVLEEAKSSGSQVEDPEKDARMIALSTTAFFPLAGTPRQQPLGNGFGREDLEALLGWIYAKVVR